ncbi:MAG: molybdopterin-synthase adenylyltransferase MoeB [bacterium]
MELTEEQINRYSRHIILKQVGGKGQKKLLESRAFLVGAGGLGSPAGYYLAAAGIGTIGIADADEVDLSNLQRQIIHSNNDIGRPKVESARETMTGLNPDVKVNTYNERISSENALEMIGDYDVIVDGCDNFPTRYLVNDAAVMLKKPVIHGSLFQFDGQCTVFDPRNEISPCYRCLYPEPPPPGMAPSCQQAGVLGAIAGIIGVLQAVECLKVILGIGKPLVGTLSAYNALTAEFSRLKLHRDPACPMCGENPSITELVDYEEFCSLH